MAHTLEHWKRDLADDVHHELERMEELTSSKLFERRAWSNKKLARYASDLMKRMEEERKIETLWKIYKDKLDLARNYKQLY